MTKRTIDNTSTPKDMLDDITDAQPKILHANTRAEWRSWLSGHFESEKSV